MSKREESPRRRGRRPRTVSGAAALLLMACATLGARPVEAQQIVGGLHFGGPVRASVAVGAGWSLQPPGRREHGAFLLAEPGLRGHRASAGYHVMLGSLGTFLSGRASWLQLRRDGDRREYVGFELQGAPLFVVGVRVGGFVPLRRDGERSVLWITDISLAL